MLDSILHNPVCWIFISYMIGALLTDAIKHREWFQYFQNRNYLSDKWTARIGVLLFGWAIRKSFMGLFNQKLKLQGKSSQAALTQLKLEMDYAECGHLIGFVALVVVNIWFVCLSLSWGYILVFFVLNIIFNLYLVLLQQYNKRRIDKALANFKS